MEDGDAHQPTRKNPMYQDSSKAVKKVVVLSAYEKPWADAEAARKVQH